MLSDSKDENINCECGVKIMPIYMFYTKKWYYEQQCEKCYKNAKETVNLISRKDLTKQKEQDYIKRKQESGLFDKHFNMTFDKGKFSKNQKEIAIKFINNPDFNMFLIGKSGTGKTYFACSIINEVIKSKPAKFYRFIDIIYDLRNSFKSDNETADIINNIFKNKIFCLDDIGVEKVTDFTLEHIYNLFDLIDITYTKGVILTSNYTLQQLAERLSDRIVSRIAGNFQIIVMKGNDNRIINK